MFLKGSMGPPPICSATCLDIKRERQREREKERKKEREVMGIYSVLYGSLSVLHSIGGGVKSKGFNFLFLLLQKSQIHMNDFQRREKNSLLQKEFSKYIPFQRQASAGFSLIHLPFHDSLLLDYTIYGFFDCMLVLCDKKVFFRLVITNP